MDGSELTDIQAHLRRHLDQRTQALAQEDPICVRLSRALAALDAPAQPTPAAAQKKSTARPRAAATVSFTDMFAKPSQAATGTGVSARETTLLAALKEGGPQANGDLATSTGIPRAAVGAALKGLTSKRLVHSVGRRRGIRWHLGPAPRAKEGL